VAALVAVLVLTLAMPVPMWRTGDQGRVPVDALPERAAPAVTGRIWIDTDAACGNGPRTDPDDCLAIALLARAPHLPIAGISTVFGNASLDIVDRTTVELAARIEAERGRAVAVHSGAPGPLADEGRRRTAAKEALRAALEQGPLTVVALGPLTNLAAVLGEHPALASRVARLVAVMGRRPGHLFHPAEGARGGMLFGHGPVFRDLNFALDPEAARRIVALRLPTTLVPYDAARGVELTGEDLERLASAGNVAAWVAERSRAWLDYWRNDIGRAGFYPFDLLAAAYVLHPSGFRCTALSAAVARDRTLFIPFWRPLALLVDPPKPAEAPVLYCARTREGLKDHMLRGLAQPAS
jgi:inosine-uridine nucleoside N-ribohydrolase